MKSLFYGALLGAAITLIAQSFISYSYAVPDPPEVSACNNSERYPDTPKDGGGKQILNAEREKWIENWEKDTVRIKSAYISKIAIDSIFSRNLTYNCLKIESALDSNQIPTLILSGYQRVDVKVNFLDQPVNTIISTENTCPHNCN